MTKTFFNVAGVIAFILAIGSFFWAGEHSGDLRSAPTAPNYATGQTIPISVRGLGEGYVDQKEWDRIGPYWNTFYLFFGLFLALMIGRVLLEGIVAFIRGWQSND